MRRAILVHGWEGSPEKDWFGWMKNQLEQKGFDVVVPAMPDAANPTYEKWVPYLEKVTKPVSENDYFIGHSLGCVTILRFLENLQKEEKVAGTVLVAGFGHDLEYDGYKGELSSFFQKPIEWQKIKTHCQKFVAIHSDDDPWVPIEHNRIYVEKLGAKSIIEYGKGHFSGDEGITQVPSALKALLEISK